MTTFTPLRHETDRGKIVGRLTDVANSRVDIAVPYRNVRYSGALDRVVVRPTPAAPFPEPFLLPTGVSDRVEAIATRTAWVQLCERLDLPLKYADRLHTDGVSWQRMLLDTNICDLAGHDDRTALLRYLYSDGEYTLRAVLSDRYDIIDDTDALTAVVKGLQDANIGLDECEVEADWTMDRFRLRIAVPAIAESAPDLLGDYRSPFTTIPGRPIHAAPLPGEDPNILWAGLEVSNSETGGGALAIQPRIIVLACRNGMTRPVDIVRRVHVGSRLERGVIDWSAETQRRSLELVTSMIADSAKTFCSTEYLSKVINEMREAKGLPVANPVNAINKVAEALVFTEAEKNSAFAAFIAGGDATVLGVGQAVTAMAQTVESSDRQSELEGAFWQIVGPLAKQLANA